MENPYMSGGVLTQEAQQELLNCAFFRILENQGGEVHVPLDDLKPEDLGGITIEANFESRTVTLRSVSRDQIDAWYEAASHTQQ